MWVARFEKGQITPGFTLTHTPRPHVSVPLSEAVPSPASWDHFPTGLFTSRAATSYGGIYNPVVFITCSLEHISSFQKATKQVSQCRRGRGQVSAPLFDDTLSRTKG